MARQYGQFIESFQEAVVDLLRRDPKFLGRRVSDQMNVVEAILRDQGKLPLGGLPYDSFEFTQAVESIATDVKHPEALLRPSPGTTKVARGTKAAKTVKGGSAPQAVATPPTPAPAPSLVEAAVRPGPGLSATSRKKFLQSAQENIGQAIEEPVVIQVTPGVEYTAKGRVRRYRPDAVQRAQLKATDQAFYRAAKGSREAVTPVRRASDKTYPLALRGETAEAYKRRLMREGEAAAGQSLIGGGNQTRRTYARSPFLSESPQAVRTRGGKAAMSQTLQAIEDTGQRLARPGLLNRAAGKLGALGRMGRYAWKHPVAAGLGAVGLAMDVGFAYDTYRDITGATKREEAEDRRLDWEIAKAQQPTVEQTLRRMDIEDLLKEKEALLARGDRGLYDMMRGLPDLTPNEAVVGAKPDDSLLREFLASDAVARGQARAEDFGFDDAGMMEE